jgi:hypothetical protein
MARIVSLGGSRLFRRPTGWRAALVLRMARHDLRRSQRELASDLDGLFSYPLTEGTIEAWEAARPVPPPRAVDAVLDLVGGDLDGLLRRVQLQELDWEPTEAKPNLNVGLELEPRTVLEARPVQLLPLLAACLDGDSLARVDSVLNGRNRPDLLVAGSLESVLGYLRTQDDLVGPRRMLPVARWLVRSIDDVIGDAGAPAHRALLSVAAQVEQFTGWLWVDAGDYGRAEHAYDVAIVRAVESGNRPLAGYMLACKSEQALTAGKAESAARLAREARSRAWGMTPVPLAWASDLEARASAVLGRPGQCNRRLDRSAELLARRRDEPPWVYHYVEKVLEVHTGICLTDLGGRDIKQAQLATQIFDHAVAAVPQARVRDRAYYLAWAAEAHARSREPERAGEVAQEATSLAVETNSTRVLRKLRTLHGMLANHEDLSQVREFGELLKTTPPS